MSKCKGYSGLALMAALSTVAIGPTAFAQRAAEETTSVKVKFSDLNIYSEAGAKALIRRIHSAAREVCGPADGSLNGTATWRNCIVDTTDRAVDKLDIPMVSAMNGYSDRSKVLLASAKR